MDIDETGHRVAADHVSRRVLARRAGALMAGGLALVAAGGPGVAGAATKKKKKKKKKKSKKTCPADKAPNILENTGAGMYTDASVANQASGFTINPSMVSCAVGTLAGSSGNVASSGPFAMLMYATRLDSMLVDRAKGLIRANGRMRSITMTGGQTTEDVEHDFIAVARDGRGNSKDRFDVHFKTPFWQPGQNPMVTPSTEYPGLARFGGELLMGDINVLS